ncbi:MAG: hypothetical protein S4CHLAM102_07460 [Chlamydiia bacterium]|nr:hypothetical protein [Chlamydiia bacterium]
MRRVCQLLLYIMSCGSLLTAWSQQKELPEIYQDVLIRNQVTIPGERSCSDRFQAIQEVLNSLPNQFKSLDIGASQGYFSFRMAEDYGARCTMIEDGYPNSNTIWSTGDYLHHLCQENSHLSNLCLLQRQFTPHQFAELAQLERFDVVIAFSVIHHMRRNNQEPFTIFDQAIENILSLAPVVIVENPINTGEHTQYIRKKLLEKGGRVIYTSPRGTLVYEIILFDRRDQNDSPVQLSNLSPTTYKKFNGTYSSIRER